MSAHSIIFLKIFHGYRVLSASLHPRGLHCAVNSSTNTSSLWKFATKQKLRCLHTLLGATHYGMITNIEKLHAFANISAAPHVTCLVFGA